MEGSFVNECLHLPDEKRHAVYATTTENEGSVFVLIPHSGTNTCLEPFGIGLKLDEESSSMYGGVSYCTRKGCCIRQSQG
jgi:hypothetical protein